jgi:hypothetical protein
MRLDDAWVSDMDAPFLKGEWRALAQGSAVTRMRS